ncbi:hypothetical protein LOZ35_001447 [Ophidiomyces ophidiicola]|uniref:Uncharacterized protein n=1 Tax=Ophidiomyces ophidiicola TaxID=1387563 RepID=A0ACB8V444_9EURO|nr:hypothetical protein LOZ62_003228 [Ophidiomyces ophidiicola]KAI1975459.1 hypothetical protein LOZ56_000658 [Ophidiomyces ophidiicola]KAI2011829.1 hypothetical protein LOZ50_000513 [Ophidiomyces ophidiicola]KAI2024205.1 hypothetical protein LOZ45_003674 [Ophidiomyces ophidiicola]KAI2054656.1 hypothetical protein LOZ38_001214 [Ophidiomyces ophidiicola]
MAKSLVIAALLAMAASSMAAPRVKSSDGGKIVGGVPAKLGEFPSMLALGWNTSSPCGAVLPDPSLQFAWVRAGSLTKDEGGIQVRIASKVEHPDYIWYSNDNDITLLHLDKPIHESPTVRYAKLPKKDSEPAPHSLAKTAGWGADKTNATVRPLLHVTIPIVRRRDCQNSYIRAPRPRTITRDMVCAGAPERDACNGDSGGPLYDLKTNELIGIVSWGEGCGSPTYPGVFTRVSKYVDWIRQNS